MFKQGQRYELASSEMKDNVPRYSLTVLDTQDESLLAQKTVGVFVVPLGVEREMDIYNEVEQRALFEVAKFARLIIVILGKTHKYESIDQIKEELNAKILGLTPPDCANQSSIPYMSTNKTLHVRDYVYEDAEMWV
jgi:hypothetical protein